MIAKFINKNLLTAYCLLLTAFGFSQDIQFSQHEAAPLLLNPAMTGNFDGKARISNCYKNQWKGISDNNTLGASADISFRKDTAQKDFVSMGIVVLHDAVGNNVFSTSLYMMSFSFHTKNNSNNQYFSAGVLGGAMQKSVNFSNITWDNQYQYGNIDPSLPSGESNAIHKTSFGDFSAGALWQYIPNNNFNLYSGISFFHLTRPNQSFIPGGTDNLDSKVSFHCGASISLSKSGKTFFLPKGFFLKQGPSHQYAIGGLFKQKFHQSSSGETALSIGCMYRINAVAIISQLQLRNFTFGFSYDVNASSFGNSFGTSGGPEISLTYLYAQKKSSAPKFKK